MKVLITGTSSGIGKGIADKFLREGHHVTGIDCNKSAIQHTAYRHICMDIRDKMHYPELLLRNTEYTRGFAQYL